MTNKSPEKENITKLVVVSVLVLIIAAAIYFGLQSNNTRAKGSNLDVSKEITNVGDVEKVIANWIENNPEAIIKSVVAMQQKASQEQQVKAQESITSKKDDIFNAKNDPSHAPKNYDVTIVEFFDYNCGYCKKAQEIVGNLIEQDKKVRIIFKELPILGSSSEELSKVAIAVNITDESKYLEFHDALMKSNAKTQGEAIQIATKVGVNESDLKQTLKNKKAKIQSKIDSNRELASSIGVNGTPAFIIEEDLFPGALSLEVLQEKISAARSK
ncbi:MAG: protein-disulfide isomerase [Lentimonas sp.]|jgi:protein-disulfide isomerase